MNLVKWLFQVSSYSSSLNEKEVSLIGVKLMKTMYMKLCSTLTHSFLYLFVLVMDLWFQPHIIMRQLLNKWWWYWPSGRTSGVPKVFQHFIPQCLPESSALGIVFSMAPVHTHKHTHTVQAVIHSPSTYWKHTIYFEDESMDRKSPH